MHEEIALELTDDGLIGHLERRVEVRATMRDFVAYYSHGRERAPSPNREPSLGKCALFVRILLATYQETPGARLSLRASQGLPSCSVLDFRLQLLC